MPIQIKSPEAIAKMRVAGRLAAEVLEMIDPYVRPNVSTQELDEICHDYIVKQQQALPAPLNYKGYPKSICTSVNHVICHGIPSTNKILKLGDIINIDITVIKDGYHGDTSKMFLVGNKGSVLAERLIRVTQEALWLAIKAVKPGNTFKDLAAAIETHARKHNFSIVEIFCGHGIGTEFHEAEPQVLHYVAKHPREVQQQAAVLQPGMIFTIEPMLNAGKKDVTILPDGWTAVTKDRSLSAQWEHTILVTDNGYEVLTLRNEER